MMSEKRTLGSSLVFPKTKLHDEMSCGEGGSESQDWVPLFCVSL